MNTSDVIGVIGVALTLIAYFCSTFNKITPNGRLFFLLNAVGAVLTCLGSFLIGYWPFFVLEATWAVVSFIGFVRVKA